MSGNEVTNSGKVSGNVPLFQVPAKSSAKTSDEVNLYINTVGSSTPVDDEAACVIPTADGGSVTAGRTINSAGKNCVQLVRYDSLGSVRSSKNLSLPDLNIEAAAITRLADGSFVVAGIAQRTGAATYDIFITKCGADLTPIPGRSFRYSTGLPAGSSQLPKLDLLVDAEGNYVITGNSNGDLLGAKFNPDLTPAWCHLFGGSTSADIGTDCQQTADGGYLFTGWTRSFGHGDADVFLVKVGGDGTLQSAKAVGDANPQYAYALQMLGDDRIVVGGSQGVNIVGGYFDNDAALAVIKLGTDPIDDLVAAVSFGPEGTSGSSIKNDRTIELIKTSGGDIVAAGYINLGSGGTDGFLAGVNTSGAAPTIDWGMTYGSGANERFNSAAAGGDGTILAAGYTEGYSHDGTKDIYDAKVGLTGETAADCPGVTEILPPLVDLSWTVTNITTLGDTAISLVATELIFESSDERWTETTLCSGPLSVPDPEAKVPSQLAINASPNPFNGAVSIVSNRLIDNAMIFNVLGQVIDDLPGGGNTVTWKPGPKVASGTYFCRVTSGKTSATETVIYQK